MAGTLTGWTRGLHWSLLVSFFTGVSAADSSVVGLAVAGCVCFIFLVGIIFYIALSFSWSDWFNTWMHGKGKVRMPKSYWKKKEEAKRKLLSATASHGTPSVINGNLPAQSVDRANDSSRVASPPQNHISNYTPTQFPNQSLPPQHAKQNGTSWVQGWSQSSNQFSNKIYEEKDVTMDLGEEQDEEFRIETVLTDNEVLDVGPFKSSHDNEKAIEGDIYPEPYIYTTINSAREGSQKSANASAVTSASAQVETTPQSVEMREVTGGVSPEEEYRVTSTGDMLVHL